MPRHVSGVHCGAPKYPVRYLHTRMCIYQHTSRAPRAITVFMKVNTPANL